jgi:hypothetical protein
VHIERFDAATADPATAAAYTSFLLAHTTEQFPVGLLPPPAFVLNRLANVSATHRVHLWLAREGSTVVGAAELSWWEAPDNRDRAWLHLSVAPYDESVVAALMAPVTACVDPLGRNLLNVEVPEGDPLEKWVEVRGGTVGAVDEHNVCRVRSLDRADLAALASNVPDGYELVAFDGACPDDLLEPYTRLMDTMNTAPRDDLTMEDWVYTPERVRDYEDGLAKRGHTMWSVIAREVATGELAAFNQLAIRPEWPEVIENEDTAVAIPHRGHGLGLWVKAVNLLRVVDSTDAVAVETWNSATNEHMLRVNRRLGFVCEHRWATWEMTV